MAVKLVELTAFVSSVERLDVVGLDAVVLVAATE